MNAEEKIELAILRETEKLTDAASTKSGDVRRVAELVVAGLVSGSVVEGPMGIPHDAYITGITYAGRIRMAELQQKESDARPTAQIKKWAARACWATAGIAGTLLTQWLQKLLNL